MLKRAGLAVLILILLVVIFTFTAMNTGRVELDLAFHKASYPISMAFAVTLVVGWLLGMLSMLAFVFRLINERRTLRRALRMSESEVSSLRNLPLTDAD